MVAPVVPDFVVQIQLSMFHAARAGEFAVTDPTLRKVLGRPTIDVRDTLSQFISDAAA